MLSHINSQAATFQLINSVEYNFMPKVLSKVKVR